MIMCRDPNLLDIDYERDSFLFTTTNITGNVKHKLFYIIKSSGFFFFFVMQKLKYNILSPNIVSKLLMSSGKRALVFSQVRGLGI